MAHLLEDPRLRQRWNQFSNTTETVTENAAAGIYSFQHRYLNPCLSSLGDAIDPCIAPCFGDRDERMRRARAREHQQHSYAARAEYTFDFYDDWDDDDELLASGNNSAGDGGVGGILGGWSGAQGGGGRGENWDRLIGGSGIARKGGSAHAVEVADQQPRRKRGMSYGTRGGGMRRKAGGDEGDPTIIPSTAPLGFLGRLPWKIGGTLRYKPSAAFLKDHPGAPSGRPDETQPLLEESGDDDVDFRPHITAHTRKRSGTGGSGDTSDSYRSRGDLFPSDGEEYEDAMEIDDEFAVALERVDDRASSNTRSSKGKRPAGSRRVSRAASGTTLSSSASKASLQARRASGGPSPTMEDSIHSIRALSIEALRREEEEAERQEDQEVARKREAAARIARERGLSQSDNYDTGESESRAKSAIFRVEEIIEPNSPHVTGAHETPPPPPPRQTKTQAEGSQPQAVDAFIPARLPNFR